jgi:hypothetical protein
MWKLAISAPGKGEWDDIGTFQTRAGATGTGTMLLSSIIG